MTKYKILCRVSGGITGTREAYLKEHGREIAYSNRAAAQLHANGLNARMNGAAHRTAHYFYRVVSS